MSNDLREHIRAAIQAVLRERETRSGALADAVLVAVREWLLGDEAVKRAGKQWVKSPYPETIRAALRAALGDEP